MSVRRSPTHRIGHCLNYACCKPCQASRTSAKFAARRCRRVTAERARSGCARGSATAGYAVAADNFVATEKLQRCVLARVELETAREASHVGAAEACPHSSSRGDTSLQLLIRRKSFVLPHCCDVSNNEPMGRMHDHHVVMVKDGEIGTSSQDVLGVEYPCSIRPSRLELMQRNSVQRSCKLARVAVLTVKRCLAQQQHISLYAYTTQGHAQDSLTLARVD